jgi:nucleoside-diphosphate-sugar epimerase
MGRTICYGSAKAGNQLSKMKIAVTGASGFIGKHVLNALLQHSVDVIAICRQPDKLSAYKDRVDIVRFDINEQGSNVYERIGAPDVLIHLAWGGLPHYKSSHHFEIELPNQYQFLKAAIFSGLQSLIATGTCFEYGMQSGALTEEIPTNPTNPYGYAKDALRRQLEFLKAEQSFDFSWLRLFYMYGEGQAETALYPMLKSAVERGESTFNMSGGEQIRDYLPVEQVAERIVLFALKKADCGVINLCSGTPISIKALVQRWLDANNWRIGLNLGYYPYPDYEPMAFWGDAGKQNKILEM